MLNTQWLTIQYSLVLGQRPHPCNFVYYCCCCVCQVVALKIVQCYCCRVYYVLNYFWAYCLLPLPVKIVQCCWCVCACVFPDCIMCSSLFFLHRRWHRRALTIRPTRRWTALPICCLGMMHHLLAPVGLDTPSQPGITCLLNSHSFISS
jgi:hypothetical protein